MLRRHVRVGTVAVVVCFGIATGRHLGVSSRRTKELLRPVSQHFQLMFTRSPETVSLADFLMPLTWKMWW